MSSVSSMSSRAKVFAANRLFTAQTFTTNRFFTARTNSWPFWSFVIKYKRCRQYRLPPQSSYGGGIKKKSPSNVRIGREIKGVGSIDFPLNFYFPPCKNFEGFCFYSPSPVRSLRRRYSAYTSCIFVLSLKNNHNINIIQRNISYLITIF